MSKQEILGFILIVLVVVVWMWVQAPPPSQPQYEKADSVLTPIPEQKTTNPPSGQSYQSAPGDSLGKFFSHLAEGNGKVLVVRTDLYTAELSSKGGVFRRWELAHYKTWDGYQVQMVNPDFGGDYGMVFLSTDGKEVHTRSLFFSTDHRDGETITLAGNESRTITYVLPVSASQTIIKKLTFRNGSYACETEWELRNLRDVIANFEYQISWESGVRFAEHNSVDEAGFAMAYVYSGGELIEEDAASFDERLQKDINGSTDWVAVRNKYFGMALMPTDGPGQGAFVEGTRVHMADNGVVERYSVSLKMPFKGNPVEGTSVKVFLGPLDFDVVKSQGGDLEKIISLGAAWIIRPIAEYFMIPLFNLIHYVVPNYGLVIIVFSLIIKILLHPLSKSSMKSMRKMQALQPMMNEIREKYKEDPQKMNQQVMNLYKEYGVNPAAGCLPLILQMPILFALYSVFRSTIDLRQANFFWWITDLSVPDVAFSLPFSIPLIGMHEVSGLALAMGVTMFIQQKMTVTDPRQKMMVWMMPVMMTILFNGLPSGLNLYYFVFNLLSIIQQMWLKKQHPDEPLRKVEPRKSGGGLLGRLSKDLPKLKR
jgi:YidC/Oxa1 family membrane protein insertase